MYFERVIIKPNNVYINIYDINLSKKIHEDSLFLASKVGRPFKLPLSIKIVSSNLSYTGISI